MSSNSNKWSKWTVCFKVEGAILQNQAVEHYNATGFCFKRWICSHSKTGSDENTKSIRICKFDQPDRCPTNLYLKTEKGFGYSLLFVVIGFSPHAPMLLARSGSSSVVELLEGQVASFLFPILPFNFLTQFWCRGTTSPFFCFLFYPYRCDDIFYWALLDGLDGLTGLSVWWS